MIIFMFNIIFHYESFELQIFFMSDLKVMDE